MQVGKGNEIFTHTKTNPHEIAARGGSCLIIYNGKTKPFRLITVLPYHQAICICSKLLHLPKRKEWKKLNIPWQHLLPVASLGDGNIFNYNTHLKMGDCSFCVQSNFSVKYILNAFDCPYTKKSQKSPRSLSIPRTCTFWFNYTNSIRTSIAASPLRWPIFTILV